jgi:aconitate hydratase
LKTGDDISTDEIMPAGAQILPYRSNIPEISKFVYSRVDESFYERAMPYQEKGFIIVGGNNYGQGSSREHAAIAPRFMGLRVVIARSFARIHWQNLINFGMLPLTFADPDDYDGIDQGDMLQVTDVRQALPQTGRLRVANQTKGTVFEAQHRLSERQIGMVLEGGLINVVRQRQQSL